MDRAKDRADDAASRAGVTLAAATPGVVKLFPHPVPGPMPASQFASKAAAATAGATATLNPEPTNCVAVLAIEYPPEFVAPARLAASVPGPLVPRHYESLQQFRPVDLALPLPVSLPSSAAVLPLSIVGDPARMPRAIAAEPAPASVVFAPSPTLLSVQKPLAELAKPMLTPHLDAVAMPTVVEGVPSLRDEPAPVLLARTPEDVAVAPVLGRGVETTSPVTGELARANAGVTVPVIADLQPSNLGTYVPAQRIEPQFEATPGALRPAPVIIPDVQSQRVAEAPSSAEVKAPWTAYARRALRYAALAFAGYLAFVFVALVLFRFINPPTSALMIQQRFAGQDIIQEWAAFEDISPNIVRAVVVSEDGRFCQHNGVDFEEMQAAIERSADGPARGASTISMQVVKNLFLWPSKSYIRKAIEIPLTYVMEILWPKRRIMEVYLNIAEWGPGIFGVEAASQFHFNKRAGRINEREAARLAVALPNPFMRDAGEPGPGTMRLAAEIQSRMHAASASQTACILKGD